MDVVVFGIDHSVIKPYSVMCIHVVLAAIEDAGKNFYTKNNQKFTKAGLYNM